MKLIIRIFCCNEVGILVIALSALPRVVSGFGNQGTPPLFDAARACRRQQLADGRFPAPSARPGHCQGRGDGLRIGRRTDLALSQLLRQPVSIAVRGLRAARAGGHAARPRGPVFEPEFPAGSTWRRGRVAGSRRHRYLDGGHARIDCGSRPAKRYAACGAGVGCPLQLAG